jgi:hypothetical protein
VFVDFCKLWFSAMRYAVVALRYIVTGIVALLLVLLLFALESCTGPVKPRCRRHTSNLTLDWELCGATTNSAQPFAGIVVRF